MSLKIGELTFLQELARRFKIPAPDFVVEPVAQSVVRRKLSDWQAGIVKPDVLSGKRGVGVIGGDVATTRDAERVMGKGARKVLQINTGGMCHLDASLVHRTLEQMPETGINVLFIENVGNLICPSYFSLGVEARVVVVSASEGTHVIEKHPAMFQSADAVVLNKIDIAEAVHMDLARPIGDLRAIRPDLAVIKTNCLAGEGIDDVLRALKLR